jgi:chromosome segregation ATPase
MGLRLLRLLQDQDPPEDIPGGRVRTTHREREYAALKDQSSAVQRRLRIAKSAEIALQRGLDEKTEEVVGQEATLGELSRKAECSSLEILRLNGIQQTNAEENSQKKKRGKLLREEVASLKRRRDAAKADVVALKKVIQDVEQQRQDQQRDNQAAEKRLRGLRGRGVPIDRTNAIAELRERIRKADALIEDLGEKCAQISGAPITLHVLSDESGSI